MSEKYLQHKLMKKFKHRYVFLNTFFFSSESDWISFLSSGYCWEVEIKVSRSDFKRDFKKMKHSLMKAAYSRKPIKKKGRVVRDIDKKIPNRFYFFAPEGVISKGDVPAYAGLYVYRKGGWPSIRKIKEAPLLHRTKLRPERVFKKLYYLYLNTVMNKLGL